MPYAYHTTSNLQRNPSQPDWVAAKPAFTVALAGGKTVVRPGSIPAALAGFLHSHNHRTWAYFSACNPHALAVTTESNRLRHETLCQLLDDEGVAYLQATDAGTGAAGVLVFDLSPQRVGSLVRAFAQSQYLYGDEKTSDAAVCEALDFAI